ncbi:MAG: ABC transporter permease [Proteobacteria bacterium]|nr:MAG: ABC transporter permease [Pseudomonadota bacterium]
MNDVSTFIGLRYLRSKKSNAFLSLITFLSVAGIALGVATLIVTLSVMDGFESALKSRLAQGEYHILATAAPAQPEAYFEFNSDQVNRVYGLSSDIQAVNPVLSTEAILRSGKRVAGMTMRGVSESQANLLSKSLVEAVDGPRVLSAQGLWLGRELAYQLSVFPGDKVQVISPTETEGPMESLPRVRVFQVDGIFSSGIPEKDLHTVYVPIASVQEFLGRPGKVNRLEITVKNFDESELSGNLVRQDLGPAYMVKDWNQLNAHLFASLKLERITMFVILSMIVLVASFNIVTSLRMTVAEKRKEIAILQAMGASQAQIGRIFLVQGAVIGNLGTVIGIAAGLGISLFLRKYPLVELPDIFFDRTLPVKISPVFVTLVAITAFCIVLLAAYFPARSAAAQAPLEGIRNV